MQDQTSIVPRVTLTVSCPLPLFIWLKQTQRNCSAFVVEAVLEKKKRDEQAEQVEA